ncbi:hypothetical protein ACNH6C_05915 [Bdellovibrio bacteriovorus]|uniref:hypothetical protein n=1 Tax=Bdellovibrio bacteriovorus TaxID=959 RepID=UPI003A803C66
MSVRTKKVILIVLTAAAFTITAAIVTSARYAEEAVDREAETILSIIHTAQKAHQKEYGYFTLDVKDLYADFNLRNFTLHTDSLPADAIPFVSKKEQPYLRKTAYQTVLIYKSDSKFWIWSIDESGNFKKLK